MTKEQVSVSDTAAQAAALSKAGKYKEASDLYKKLLLAKDNKEWSQQLADCYLQRALAFAARDMCKEAVVLWDNYTQHAQPPLAYYDRYIVWLIQTKNQAKLLPCLQQLSAEQLDKTYPNLATLWGLLILTDHPEYERSLPQDSAFIVHLKLVQQALHAYKAQQMPEVDEALKLLPFRSAFRDFRTLLKAAGSASASGTEAQALLTKIPANSPYFGMAGLLSACTKSGSALVNTSIALNYQQRKLVGNLIGLDKKQLEIIDYVSKQAAPLSDKIKFNLAIQYQALFGAELSQQFCLAMLPQYPAGQRDFSKAFGPAINAFEENRLKALHLERSDKSYDANFYWRQCINALVKTEADNSLRIALILRHMAINEPSEQVDDLIESLDYDPEDRDCYLQILDYYRQLPEDAKSYQKWLSKTLKKFPQDVEVLTQAIQAASAQQDYKNAGQYALQLLKVDALNSFAKQILFASCLSNARQLIKDKKFQLVAQEIQQADELKLGKQHALQSQLLRDLLCYAAEDKNQGLQRITETLTALHPDPINSQLQAAMEAQLTGLPITTILKQLPPLTDYLLSETELSGFIKLLNDYGQHASHHELLHKALLKVKTAIKKSVNLQNYPEQLLLSLCQALDSIKHFELLRHSTKWAQAQWRFKPIWMYYRIYAETTGMPEKCNSLQLMRLQMYHEQARQEKDQRAMQLLSDYLDRYYDVYPSFNSGFPAIQFAEQQHQDTDPFDELFGHLPDDIFVTLNKKLAALLKKTSPERLLQQLKIPADTDQKIHQAIMQNPDLYTALMIIKAAEDLGLVINVSVADVLSCFGVNNNPRSFTF
ncbi:MAG: hypothetical protein ABL925_05335 [Methylococcales bacterium]